jgi:hypothetical protein
MFSRNVQLSFHYKSILIPLAILSILINTSLNGTQNGRHNDPYMLELDFEPFNVSVPRPNRSSSIGNGVQFLNRHLSSIMFRNRDCLEPLLDFLRGHRHKGHVSSDTDGNLGQSLNSSYVCVELLKL